MFPDWLRLPVAEVEGCPGLSLAPLLLDTLVTRRCYGGEGPHGVEQEGQGGCAHTDA